MPELATITWTEARGLDECVLVVPVGATEQHGPHLPLTTDTDIAVSLAHRLVTLLPDKVVVAPPVPFGASGEHEGFPGTISIGLEATEQLLVELGRSASRTWQRMLLISTHGGNHDAVVGATRRLRAEGRDVLVWMPSWGGDAHAGRTETSLMLATRNAAVRPDAAVRGETAPLSELIGEVRRSGVRVVSPNGVLGDPMGANATEGQELLDQATAILVSMVSNWPCLDPGHA